MSKQIYFDCEFTQLSISGSLISAGFVADTGEELYAEVGDYELESCSEFVAAIVLPLLSLQPVSTSEFVCSLRDWVGQADTEIRFIADSDWDRIMLTKSFDRAGMSMPANWSFGVAPENLRSGTQRQIFDQELAAFFMRKSAEKRHHALSDARSIQHAYACAKSGW